MSAFEQVHFVAHVALNSEPEDLRVSHFDDENYGEDEVKLAEERDGLIGSKQSVHCEHTEEEEGVEHDCNKQEDKVSPA